MAINNRDNIFYRHCFISMLTPLYFPHLSISSSSASRQQKIHNEKLDWTHLIRIDWKHPAAGLPPQQQQRPSAVKQQTNHSERTIHFREVVLPFFCMGIHFPSRKLNYFGSSALRITTYRKNSNTEPRSLLNFRVPWPAHNSRPAHY